LLIFESLPNTAYFQDYSVLVDRLNELSRVDEMAFLGEVRRQCQGDLFFLMYFVLRINVNHPWLVERIKEVQFLNDNTLDLWSREHFKSSIITYALNIQEILNNPEHRIGIFSHTRNLAKAFLRRIKQTFESNAVLKAAFPDILWGDPKNEAPKWSEDDGIVLRRKGVYQEATVEAYGLIDGMPTGKHYSILNYDDVVTRESVTTPDQMSKVSDCFRLSLNLGAGDLILGTEGKKRIVGTIYHFNDLYVNMEKSGDWIVRKHPVVNEEGEYVLLKPSIAEDKRRRFGPYVWATQMMLNPVADDQRRFLFEWLQFYDKLPRVMTLFLLVDPASSKKVKASGSDYTVMWLWGLDERGNRFLVDMVRDRLSLTERWTVLRNMIRKWPSIQRVGYERYGMQADVEYFRERMSAESFFFPLFELGGSMAKEDRILRLVPWFEQGRIWLPHRLEVPGGRDLINEFINEEYLFFPFAPHDDMLDAASRIEDSEFYAYRPYSGTEDLEDKDENRDGGIISLGWAEGKRQSRFAYL